MSHVPLASHACIAVAFLHACQLAHTIHTPPSLLALLPARCAPQVDRMISETESKPENAFAGSSVRQPLAWMPAALPETAACTDGAAALPAPPPNSWHP